MKTHKLKTWPKVFAMSTFNLKSFEYRKNDKNFEAGDNLLLEEWDPETKEYTGKFLSRQIVYIQHGGQFGIPEGYCIMSVVMI